MANYYELLKVQPTASSTEIEAAIETQYNQWRRLVTHHDPNVVNQANQALASLQHIRAILTDPGKRAGYDAAIGLSGQSLGGLADPEALLSQASSAPTPIITPPGGIVRTPPASTSATKDVRLDAWECPKCKSPNPIGTRHCKKCGAQVGISCPKCNHLIDVNAKHCSECGADIQRELQQKKAAEEERAKLEALRKAEEIKKQQEAEQARVAQTSVKQVQQKKSSRAKALWGVLGVIGICICLSLAIKPLSSLGKKPGVGIVNIIATPTPDPMVAALNPNWSNSNLSITTYLERAEEDYFYIGLTVDNLTTSSQIVTFLTSDVIVSDNLGNLYPPNDSTKTVRDEMDSRDAYYHEKEYRFSYKGSIPANATELFVNIKQINDVQNLNFVISLPTLTNQLNILYNVSQYSNDGIRLSGEIENISQYPFLARFKATDISLQDDLGNSYILDENQKDYVATKLIQSGSSISDYESFSPGIDPRAKTLTFTLPIMGQVYTQTFDLGIADANIRYEAKVNYVSSDYFSVNLTIFNLGDKPLIARYDANLTTVTSPSGQVYSADADRGRAVYIVGSGDEETNTLYFIGVLGDMNNLSLNIPVISSVENIQIPVMPKE